MCVCLQLEYVKHIIRMHKKMLYISKRKRGLVFLPEKFLSMGFVSSFSTAQLWEEPHLWLLQYPLKHQVESVPVISTNQGRILEFEVNEEYRS